MANRIIDENLRILIHKKGFEGFYHELHELTRSQFVVIRVIRGKVHSYNDSFLTLQA